MVDTVWWICKVQNLLNILLRVEMYRVVRSVYWYALAEILWRGSTTSAQPAIDTVQRGWRALESQYFPERCADIGPFAL